MSRSNVGKNILAIVAIVLAVLSFALVIIYATLAVDVIEYTVLSDRQGWEGLGAAVGIAVMLIVCAGIALLMIIGAVLFVLSRRVSGWVRVVVKITFIYHVLAVVLAIITLIAVKFLS